MFYELAEKALAIEKSGKKVLRLNVGDTNLAPPACAVEAAKKELEKGVSGYGSSAGMPALIEKIAEREKCSPREVAVGPGSKLLIFAVLSTLLGKNRNISFPSPYWPAYELICRQLGINFSSPKASFDSKWQFVPEGLAAGSGAVIVCNPLNPTSTLYSEKSMGEIAGICADSKIPLLIDEAYRGISFKKHAVHSPAIRVRSFSKEFNMEGWRLGYVVADPGVVKKIIAFNQISITCVPKFIQAAGLACLENEKEILADNTRIWKSRVACAASALKAAGFKFAEPDSGMYVFAAHERIADAGQFSLRLLEEKHVAVAPGSDFGGYGDFIRICLNREEAELRYAIGVMDDFTGK